MSNNKQKYGFITAISMVIGIVIGSGIFFKADDILIATGGSVKLGLLGFLVVGIGVLFGSLVISEYAINNPGEGGIIAFSKDAFGKKVAYYISWFMVSVYFPAIIVILAFVTAIYISVLFGISSNIFLYVATILVIASAFLTNVYSKRLGGQVQSVATALQLVPLFIIGTCGLLFFSGNPVSQAPVTEVVDTAPNFFAALITIAFTFDGWIVVTSIANEVKRPRKTVPIALSVGVLLTTIIYILYFIGMTNIVAPTDIIALGDAHVDLAASQIFGQYGSKFVTTFVVIAVYGGVNGMVLAYLRLPHALVSQGMMKNILNIKQVDEKTGLSAGSIKFAAIVLTIFTCFQILINEQIIFGNLETAFDLSTLPITIIYIIYIGLYLRVFKVTKKKGFELIKITIFMLISIFISAIVIYGALQVNGLLYIGLSALSLLIGIPFCNYKKVN